MSEKSWPWISSGGDRTVTAAMVSQAQADEGFIGVLGGLAPTKSGSSVLVSAGSAVINGVRYVLDAQATVTPAAGTRKDYVVLRYTASSRDISLAVLQGSSSAFPTLTKTAAVYELAIASVDNSGGAFTVADTRANASLCGRKMRQECGTGSASLGAGATTDVAVTFAKAFEATPTIVIGKGSSTGIEYAHAGLKSGTPSTSGFSASLTNTSNGSKTVSFQWIAMGY